MKTKQTGPAWRVRQQARDKFFKEIKDLICVWEEEIGLSDLHRIFVLLLNKRLVFSEIGISNNDLPEISFATRERVFRLFCQMSQKIRAFQRTEEEGYLLTAAVLKFVAGRIFLSCYLALQRQEHEYPKLVYGVAGATDHIPID